jgi:predicted nucleic acid-binding protein
VRKINLHKEDLIAPKHRRRAYELCRDIDETDTPHVALTFEWDGELWTGDKKLKKQEAEERGARERLRPFLRAGVADAQCYA